MGTIDTGVLLDERYRIVRRRAAGATATVWEAEDDFLRRRVAVKTLHEHLAADEEFLARFVDEARTAATVNHPSLVAVYDSITDQPGIVLEWIDGPDLRQRLDEGPLAPEEAARIGAAICDGLAALHASGLVHRDVKPANILLTREGEPKLTDFGIATANAGDRTATGVVLGTAKYLAPEQVRGGRLDGRADVFALAAVLYESLSGAPPWQREGDLATALARLEEDPPDLPRTRPDLPLPLTDAVTRGLARDPADRWPSAAAFATALRGGSTLAPPPAARPQSARPHSARPHFARPHSSTVALPRPASPAPPARPIRPRRRRWPHLLGAIIAGAIAALGWTLISAIDGDPEGSVDPDAPSPSGAGFDIHAVAAYDPEGSGPAGEHNERAGAVIDGDRASAWTTERYRSRDLGAKSGVGLVLTLDRVRSLSAVTIETVDAEDWAVELRVADGITTDDAGGIADFGPQRGGGSGLGAAAELALSGTGDTVVVWITDLGSGPTPIALSLTEITIR